MLTRDSIREKANIVTWQKGNRLFREDGVSTPEVEFPEDTGYTRIRVRGRVRDGSRRYEPELTIVEDEIRDHDCHCPDNYYYSDLCSHCVALALKLIEQQKDEERRARSQRLFGITRSTSEPLKKMMYRYTVQGRLDRMGDLEGAVELECSFQSAREGLLLECRLGTKRMYVVKNLVKFIRDVEEMQSVRYGQKLEFVHDPSAFTERSRRLIERITEAVETIYPNFRNPYFAFQSSQRQILLRPAMVERFLELYRGETIRLDEQEVPVEEGDPAAVLRLKEVPGGAQLSMEPVAIYRGRERAYVKQDYRFTCCSEEFAAHVLPIWEVLGREDILRRPVFLSREDYGSFCGNVLPALRPYVEVDSGSLNLEEFAPAEPHFSVYMTMPDADSVRAEARVTYEAETFDLLKPETVGGPYRNYEREQDLRSILQRYFRRVENENGVSLTAEGGDALFLLADRGLAELQTAAELFVDDSIRRLQVRKAPKVTMGIGYRGDLLQLEMQVEGMDRREVQDILAAYRRRKKYYRLKNGDFLRLEDSGLGTMAELAEGLQIPGEKITDDTLEIPVYRALYLESVTDRRENLQVKKSGEYRQLVRTIREYSACEYEVPEEIRADLRWYQRQGFQWLSALCDMGFGGILADDMGLGKTLEMITLFADRIRRGETRPILVVTPASLLYNWENEVRRFAPHLTVEILAGTAGERKEKIETLGGAQIYITSYDMLRRDIEQYAAKEFAICVLDEAQYIKNAGTQSARAVKELKAAHRFAMTGTPMENRLSDLWSIFDYLMPGYLFSYRIFQRELEGPIVREDDDTAMARLQKMVTPFLLRRRKADVLKDLPDKLEENIFVSMTAEQRRLYDATLEHARSHLAMAMEESGGGVPESVLREITRICRLCDSPELEYENYSGGSGKVETCLQMIASAVDGGHRILVYSHYTGMLELLQRERKRRNRDLREGEDYLYFHGAVSPARRQAMVDRFQRGDIPVMFISLKAGGTGLNLTAADMVIHCDPWWNEAAQDQATARAWRIGQTRDVTVFRLVSRNSIEEKILTLQQKKAALSDRLLEGDAVREFRLDRDTLLELFGQ